MNDSGNSIFAINQAHEHLIDKVMQRQEKAYAGEALTGHSRTEDFSVFSIDSRDRIRCEKFEDYTKFRAAYPNQDSRAAKVAVLTVMGVIEKTEPEYQPYYVSTQKLVRNLEMCVADPEISAVVLYFDTPGGHVDGTEYAARKIAEYNKILPIYSQVSGLCASAGYWLASQTRGIYADSKADMIGSIGVVSTHASYKRMYENEGIDVTVLVSKDTPDKAVGNRFTELSDEDREKLENELTAVKTIFTNTVLEGRGDKIKNQELAFSGAVYLSNQAQKIGLIDGVAQLKDTVLKAFKDSTKKMSASSNGNKGWLASMLPNYKATVTEDVTLTAAEATELQHEVESLRASNADLAGKVEALKAENVTALKDGEALKTVSAELAQAQSDLTNLRAELETLRSDVAAKTETVNTLSAELETVKTDLTAANESVTTLTAEKSEISGKLDNLTAEYNKLSKGSAVRINTPTPTKNEKPEEPQKLSALEFAKFAPTKGIWKSAN